MATLSKLSKINTFRSLALIFLDWLVIAAGFYLFEKIGGVAGFILAVIIVGNRQHALGLMGHDGVHFLLHKNQKVNDVLTGVLTLWPIGNGVNAYRDFHFEHHRYLGTTKDPEQDIRRLASPTYDLPSSRWKILKYWLRDVTGLSIPYVIEMVIKMRLRSKFDKIGCALLWTILLLVCWQLNLWMWVAIWFTALNTVFWATFRLRIWSEHTGTTGTLRLAHEWWSRILFLQNYAGYHYEHHQWPSVPCWNLPKARTLDTETQVLTIREVLDRFEGQTNVLPIPYEAKAAQ